MEFRELMPNGGVLSLCEGAANKEGGEAYIPTELLTGNATESYNPSFIDPATFGHTFDWYNPLEGLGHEGALGLSYDDAYEIPGNFLSSGTGDILQGYYPHADDMPSGTSPTSIDILDWGSAYGFSPAPSTHSQLSTQTGFSPHPSPTTGSSLASPLSYLVDVNVAAPPALLSPVSARAPTVSSTYQVNSSPSNPLNDSSQNLITDGLDLHNSTGLAQILVTKGRVELLEEVRSLTDDIDATKIAGTNEVEIPSKRFTPFFETTSIRQTAQRQQAKRFECVFCNYYIGNRTQIVQHLMRRHFFYSPYRCVTCTSSFCRQADLKKHVEDKHSGKRFPCSCKKTYTNDRNRRRHQERSPFCSSSD